MKKNNNKKSLIITIVIIALLAIIGVSYAWFRSYETTSSRQLVAGEVYLTLTDGNDQISLTNVFPETSEEARSSTKHVEGSATDNTFTFTVQGKNDGVDTLYYKVQLTQGNQVNDKIRLQDEHLMFDLIELGANDSETYLVKARNYPNLNNPTVYIGSVAGGATVNKTYKLRMWVSDEITISDTDSKYDYKETGAYAFKNHFGSVKVAVLGEIVGVDKPELYQMMNTNPTLDTNAQFATISSGGGIYKRLGTESDDYPILYYRGNVTNNNVYFAGFCWKIVRTTETGGIKLIYNGTNTGTASAPACENNTYESTIIGSTAQFNIRYQSPAYVGYMYGAAYEWTNEEPVANAIFGNGFTYRSGVYTLKNTKVGIDSTHHYTCNLTNASGTCASIRYYYYYGTSSGTDYRMFITLTGGKSIEDALDEMFENTTSSNAKQRIDAWYIANLNTYTDKLEDTIWCNDRSISTLGGWDPNGGGITSYLDFNGKKRRDTTKIPSLECPNKQDAFTVRNNKGNRELNYPVALLTSDEIMLAGGQAAANNSYYLYVGSGDAYAWSLSPYIFYIYDTYGFSVHSSGDLGYLSVGNSYGLRPSVSLRPGTLVSGGTGIATDPYIVE